MCSVPRSSRLARPRFIALAIFVAFIGLGRVAVCPASDHLDTPTVIADPRSDIGDVYAWMSPKGHELNLIMTIVGHTFSDKLDYVFHVDSGASFGHTTATTLIQCRFPTATVTECHVGDADSVRGDASNPEGLVGTKRRFRIFAGLRDDPFFNNVKGTRAAYTKAEEALRGGTPVDAARCPAFAPSVVQAIRYEWQHTDGGPASNFLAGWTPAAIVIAVDVDAVSTGGKFLAVWGTTNLGARQIDRAARPLTGNALLGLLASEDYSNDLKEQYNAATPSTSQRFIPEIQKALGLYDGFDGKCGNQLLADPAAAPDARYRPLATLLADDRLWVNSASNVCTQLFGVELANLAGQSRFKGDCGGRAPNYDASNVYRSLLVDGSINGIDDGLHADERQHSDSVFPFLAAPEKEVPHARN